MSNKDNDQKVPKILVEPGSSDVVAPINPSPAKSFGSGLKTFKRGVNSIMTEQSIVRMFGSKKAGKDRRGSGIKEITADNILKAKKEKKNRETRAQGKNILDALGGVLKNKTNNLDGSAP